MKYLICIGLIIFSVVGFTRPVAAHVLVPDESGTRGAVLHVIPDDDPIAGQESSLYFDMKGDRNSKMSVVLTVADQSGKRTSTTAKVEGALATVRYVFPTQGVYSLTFTVREGGATYSYTQSQRVSRGTLGTIIDTPRHVWAEVSLIASLVGMILLIIIAVNRRKEIVTQRTLG